MTISFAMVACSTTGATTLPARRPSAGAVPGRWGGLLGGKDPTGRLFFTGRTPTTLRAHSTNSTDGRDDAGQRVHDKGAGLCPSQLAMPPQPRVDPGRVHDVPRTLAHEQVRPFRC